MSNLLVKTSEMHKIAQFPVNIKYRRPGNIIEYVAVEFEIFRDGKYYKAIPIQDYQTRLLTNLPNQLVFEIKKDKFFNYRESEEVVEDIVEKLMPKIEADRNN